MSLDSYFKGGSQVTIYVGPEREKWVLSEDLLCDRVPFFKAAFKSAWKEGKEKVIELPEDNPKAFAVFVDLVFLGYLACNGCRHNFEVRESSLKHPSGPYDIDLFALWVFADKIHLPNLASEAIRMLRQCAMWHSLNTVTFSRDGLRYVYENTTKSSALRLTLIDVMVERYYSGEENRNYKLMSVESLEDIVTGHEEFTVDLLKGVFEHTLINSPECQINWCRMHNHQVDLFKQ